MAQLSIYDKLKHYSDKDVTISIGKRDVVYITFRHDSWKHFTPSEYLNIAVEGNHIKFKDPEASDAGVTLKLKKSNYGSANAETSRYIQIDGRKYPAILEIARRAQGSYNIPAQKKVDVMDFKPKKPEKVTSSQLAKEHGPDLDKLNEELKKTLSEVLKSDKLELRAEPDPKLKTVREQFMDDALALCQTATTSEERTAIYNALAVIYGGHDATSCNSVQLRATLSNFEQPDETAEEIADRLQI